MSRIEDAFKRISGATADQRSTPALDGYSPEKPSNGDHAKTAMFAPGGPHALEAKSPIRQKAASPTAPVAPMPAGTPSPAHAAHAAGETETTVSNEKLVDFRQLFDYTGFIARSIQRHWLLALGAFAFAFGLTVGVAALVPKTYHVSTKLLAQRNAVMTALSNPGRPIPWDADAPTRAAAETVLRRDNLIDLIQKTDLIRSWERTREPILRLKDWIIATGTGYRPTEDDKLDSMIGLLENNMFVTAGPVGDGTVSIDLDWRNPEMGFRLVEVAQRSFLEARAKAETQAIDESIRILEDHADELSGNITTTLSELDRTQKSRNAPRRPVSRLPMTARSTTPSAAGDAAVPSLAAAMGLTAFSGSLDTDPEVARIGATINLKKQEIGRLEADRDRQATELRAQLSRLTQVYTSSYPDVITTQRNLDSTSQDSPQLSALRRDVDRLERELKQREDEATDRQIQAALERRAEAATPAPVSQAPTTARPEPQASRAATVPVGPVAPPISSDAADFATLRLRSELNQYESVLERTASAKIELTVSQAAFKYRYTVIRPAEVPKEPSKPKMSRILIAGFAASLFVGLMAAVGKDLLSNRILEAWQIERQLGLPVLGTLETV